jgi:NADPH:quinone reductase-like Zn-dependent oxidoreductase
MAETMRMEGHTALVHKAAASSLGIMLNKVCIKEGVALVNIVRKQEQVDLLTKLGAKFVVNSSSESFKKDLYKAIDDTGATLAFDATGFNTYGSVDNKQVYIYGGLDFSPTLLNRAFGMT